ncbi:vacuolar protein sorting-associated protein VTA1 homolog [Phlebotomus argentipes]|uniref:vacuolar protein sorting-associated protein VTA1 homolog n=1 Tax=Phlebotomus argentipes TaxID=94469 RepID=UPI002892F430|nr:vacuolar protein sorting-associated protein VTA1 homolog [Phlebotomus argentipes]
MSGGVQFSECPPSLKNIAHYLKTALEHDSRDIIVAYWSRLYALQLGLKLSSQKPEETKLFLELMDWLEKTKKEHSGNESITNEVAGQAYLENYALKLFLYADKQDREGNFGKNVVKAFYTAGMIYDVLLTFGELTDEVQQNRKYAKWKAAYIHNCLKNGETPVPGPMATGEEGEDNEEEDEETQPSEEAQAPPAVPINPDTGAIDITSPEQLPDPPKEPEKPPGGFQAYVPPGGEEVEQYQPVQGEVSLTPDQISKAQKYCKWAGSALTYDDISTAIDNLQKALRLLKTGQDA